MVRAFIISLVIIGFNAFSQNTNSKWQYVGPRSNFYQFKGLFMAVWADENDLNNILAGSHTAGLFATNNALSDKPVWKNITDNLPYMNFGVSGIVVKKNSMNKDIYISTWTGSGLILKGFGNGILHSVNGGESWEHLGPTGNTNYDFPLQGLVANNFDQDQMAAFDHKDLYLTKDSWKTFQKIELPFHKIDNIEIAEVEYAPYEPGTIYVCTRTYIQNKAQLFVTHDGGITWKDMTPEEIACERIAIATIGNPKYKGKFYVTSGNTSIYVHYFNGKEFSKPLNQQPITHLAASSYWCLELRANQRDTSVLYVSLTETSMSVNGGKNFSKIGYYNGSNTHADVRDMHLAVSTEGGKADKLLLANDGGISLSNHLLGGEPKFKNMNGEGLDANMFWGIDVLQSDSLFIAGGAQDNGGFFFRERWETNNLGACGDGYYGLVLNDSLALNLCNPPMMILHNSNRSANTYISIPDKHCEARRPLIKKDSFVYVGYHDIWQARIREIVAGKFEFKNVSNITNVMNGAELKNREIKAMAISPYNTAMVGYANPQWNTPENSGKLFYCSDISSKNPVYKDVSRLNCTSKYEFCRWWHVESIAADVWDENVFYLIYKSTDNQMNCFVTKFVYDVDSNKAEVTDISYNLKKVGFNKLKVDDDLGVLYAATCDGIYYLLPFNGDTVWKSLNFFPKVMVSDIVFNNYNNKIYAATFGRGIWCSSMPVFNGRNVRYAKSRIINEPIKVDGNLIIDPKRVLTFNSNIIITTGSKIHLKKKAKLVIRSRNKVRNELNEVVDIEPYLIKHKTASVIYLNN